MKNIVLAMLAAAGILLVTSLEASAIPADGATIARIGQQVEPVINAATKKKKAQAQTQPQAKPACPADQVRSNRTGFCIPQKGQGE
jgi:hypothetical protein